MENTQISQIKIQEDLRQSEKWAQYLSWIGWKSFVVGNNIRMEIFPTRMGSMVKIQRPGFVSQKDLEEVDKVCKEDKSLFAKIEPLLDQDVSVFEKAGYVKSYAPLSPPSTIYINLISSEEVLWKNLTKTTRHSIKKSTAKTQFYRAPSEEVLETFYRVASETSKKQNFTIQTFDDLKKKAEVFGEDAYIALAYGANGDVMGGKFFLANKNVVWYLHAGTTEAGRRADSGDKMMWDSFLYFKKMGFEIMDMDGIDDPRFPLFTKRWGGFSFFKEKFGGEIIRFPYSYIKYFNSFFRFINKIRPLPL